MAFAQRFCAGYRDVGAFLDVFHLSYKALLLVLRETGAIVTGRELLVFMTGGWKRSIGDRPRSLTLDVVCHGIKARGALERLLEASKYRRNEWRCRHDVGEWAQVPEDKISCFVRGELHNRVVHLVELPRPPQEVVLSRTYGNMAGTYLGGAGSVISLFPDTTFEQVRYWLPSHKRPALGVSVARKYVEWQLQDKDGCSAELGARMRSIADKFTWQVKFDEDGQFSESWPPLDKRYGEMKWYSEGGDAD
jgi:hypothetical protein